MSDTELQSRWSECGGIIQLILSSPDDAKVANRVALHALLHQLGVGLPGDLLPDAAQRLLVIELHNEGHFAPTAFISSRVAKLFFDHCRAQLRTAGEKMAHIFHVLDWANSVAEMLFEPMFLQGSRTRDTLMFPSARNPTVHANGFPLPPFNVGPRHFNLDFKPTRCTSA
jgi:hypothetical protein